MIIRAPTLFATQGLPGSGKTTYARKLQRENPKTVLVSKDELRAMLHGGRYSKANESSVLRIRDAIINDALSHQRDVVVHDVNFGQMHLVALEAIAQSNQALFVLIDLTGVPLNTCIRNDARRTAPIGEEVITRMWRQYL